MIGVSENRTPSKIEFYLQNNSKSTWSYLYVDYLDDDDACLMRGTGGTNAIFSLVYLLTPLFSH